MEEGAIQTRKWTRVEYERLVECDILGPDDKIELLGGEMIVKEPQYSPHAAGIQLVARALRRAFGEGLTRRWSSRSHYPDSPSTVSARAACMRGRGSSTTGSSTSRIVVSRSTASPCPTQPPGSAGGSAPC